MSDLSDAIDEARTELADAGEEFMPDLCDLVKMTLTDGGSAGDSIQRTTLATNVPCGWSVSAANSQLVVGGKAYAGRHRLKLVRTDETMLITPEYWIKVQARGDTAEQVFEEPIIISGSFAPFLTLAATLVQHGYQQ